MPQFHLPELAPLPLDAKRTDIEKAFCLPRFLLEAKPGTGKSTRVPLWALEHFSGRILLLEPRRAAARMLAEHLASLLHTSVGGLVGLVMRRMTKISKDTRLFVITEGVLTRMLCDDPSLENADCVLFDEFHERHLTSDTGLALALRSQELFRPDLVLGILSATMDTASLSAFLKAPVISTGTTGFPVRTIYCPPRAGTLADCIRILPEHMAQVIARCMQQEKGSLLAFLPGEREILRTKEALAPLLPADCDILPLYGRLPGREQALALSPCKNGRRKAVLATDIAESSLTIEGIRIVCDSGLHKRIHYDPKRLSSRLVTRRIPLSSADQRRGRAGRTEPGLCVRLWSEASEAGMLPHALPEILEADLSPLVLDLALWGEEAKALPFVTKPPCGTLEAAANLLKNLGALDRDGRITKHGQDMAGLGLSPRTASILLGAEEKDLALAALVCAFLEEQQKWKNGQNLADLLISFAAGATKKEKEALTDQAAYLLMRLARHRKDCLVPDRNDLSCNCLSNVRSHDLGRLLLKGYADKLVLLTGVAKDDGLSAGIMRSGTGILMPQGQDRFVLALESTLADTGRAQAGSSSLASAKAALFCPVAEDDVLSVLSDHIEEQRRIRISDQGQASVFLQRTLDALVLSGKNVPAEKGDSEGIKEALCAFVLKKGLDCLPFTETLAGWLARVTFAARQCGSPWPLLDRASLLAGWESWLPELLDGCSDTGALSPDALSSVLHNLVPWQCQAKLNSLAPSCWTAPSGRSCPIHYEEETPFAEAKLQECFGLAKTPLLAGNIPLALHLLSPSGRILAVTSDPGTFWREVYPSVRSEMRGRYPRHPWPEDPLAALPTALSNKALRNKGLL